MELYRKTNRPDALLAIFGEAIEKKGAREPFAGQGKTIASDAALLHAMVEAAHKRQHAGPEKLSSGMRQAVALLALEAKQYDTAAEFFDLAFAAAQAGGLIGAALGHRTACQRSGPGGRQGFSARHRPEAAAARRSRRFTIIWPTRWPMCNRPDEALAAARKSAEIEERSAQYCSHVPLVLYHAKRYDEAITEYTKLVNALCEKYDSAETRETLRNARMACRSCAALQESAGRGRRVERASARRISR